VHCGYSEEGAALNTWRTILLNLLPIVTHYIREGETGLQNCVSMCLRVYSYFHPSENVITF